MPCGKRPVRKLWDRPRKIKVIVPSKYEKNEASVRLHWRNVVKELELSYKDEKFWESQAGVVKELVNPIIFQRLQKIFNLQTKEKHYVPHIGLYSPIPSDQFFKSTKRESIQYDEANFSLSDFGSETEDEELSEQDDEWDSPSEDSRITRKSGVRSSVRAFSRTMSRMKSKSFGRRSLSKFMSKIMKSASSRSKGFHDTSIDERATSQDDLEVQVDRVTEKKRRHLNPHYKLLYCSANETDMISWNSKYRTKSLEVSASDEFNKKAEIMTKKIAMEFFEWWRNLGTEEFKSEIKKPENIEELFQVWFDEHASRGLVLDPKTLPCVLEVIAKVVGVPKASCRSVLKRQIAYDIHAETSPQHVVAFGTCLPQKMKHIPPNNNTDETWHCVKIPEDLRSMTCVWGDIEHLTSTKSFHLWLQKRPQLPMPPCFASLEQPGEKKQLFVVPSDFVLRSRSSTSASTHELSLPVSQFTMELKEVLNKLMNE